MQGIFHINKKTRLFNFGQNARNVSGFTIVELLIVIVIIGILAAISIVAYNGIQNRANDTAIQNDLKQMQKQVELHRADNSVYPNPTAFFSNAKISKGAYSTSVYNLYYCTDRNDPRERYGIAARSTSGQTFTISSTSEIKAVSGTPAWGVACGAFGESSSTTNITFNYGFNLNTGAWQFNL